MYVWIWRHLPGGLLGRIAGSVVLVAAVVALLFLVVFPWAEPRLPFNHVTVDTPAPAAHPGTPSPSAPPPLP